MKPLSNDNKLAILALMVVLADQASKLAVLKTLGYAGEKIIIDGFFKFVHWGNTGAAWSMFSNNNDILAIVALVAFGALFLGRRHFAVHTTWGWISLGLMFGGIIGNVIDRLMPTRRHVIDFLYFYVKRRGDFGTVEEIGFPAFNVADSAICIGVFILMILSVRNEMQIRKNEQVQTHV